MKVAFGFVSFTEVEAGAHESYNRWHLFDHLPEQLPLDGIVWGQRWVLTPELRATCRAAAPLDRVHYVTLYLLAEPIDTTLAEFRALAVTLRGLGRFHQQRTAHLAGPLAVESAGTADPRVISAEAVPFRPCRGVHVRLERRGAASAASAPLELGPGVAGTWTFTGHDELSPPELQGTRATWSWLDEDPTAVARDRAVPADPSLLFDGVLATVDPFAPWDWFEDHP